MEEAKQEVTEIVDFLKNPEKYSRLGGRVPKGALLVGPPGTGKTMLAKAVAGEANVPFFSRSGSQFVEKFVGVGASRVRELFAEAKEKAPCVVFIDEIDAVGTKRSNEGFNSEHDQTLNQLLTEMDGIDGASGVIVLAATNREDILDDALLRPGRFDRKVHVTLPALTDREAIFKVHLKKVKVDETVDLTQLARQTPGMSGAEIANVCNEAAILAARQNREAVTMADFNEAIDKVTLGLENKSMLMTRQDVYETAVHEAGHTTTIWLLEHAAPLVKISIVPRGKALGVNMTMPEERVGYTKQAFLDEICSFMGGRAAEELFLGTIGTGALNDMQQATRIARSMVMYYGMSEKMPNISYYDPQGQLGQRPYSDERARLIDEETSRIVNEQYERAKKLISEHAEQHHKVVDALMEKEVIFAADVEAIFGKRPWKSRTEQLMEVAEARRKSQH
ncbi:MAG: ATP-dependent zinc metalloprotease FtsH [Muribaculaceae bacterium]|nr:ATP-dependent zinc metalloprotease FtsH [Muribaculaceae bacterium]